MNAARYCVLAAVLLGGLAPTAAAVNEVTVIIHYKSVPPCNGGYQTLTFDAGEAISIPNVTGCVDWINIYASSASHDIGRVTLGGNPSEDIFIRLDSGYWDGSSNASFTPRCNDWAGLGVSGDWAHRVHIEGAIAGDLTDTVVVGQVHRFEVLGELRRGIQAEKNISTAILWFESGSIAYPGNVTATAGGIGTIHAGGDCTGSIWATGNINTISVGGDLLHGSFAEEVHSGGRINKIEVGGKIGDAASSNKPVIVATSGIGAPYSGIIADSIHADITTDDGNSINNALWYLETRNGDLSGSITARYINRYDPDQQYYGMVIDGDIDATIHITQNCDGRIRATGVLTENAVIRIARDLNAYATIELAYGSGTDLDALKGQIVINAEDGDGLWENDVVVDGDALAPISYYNNPSAEVGGGAVGLVPYYLHYQDCNPPGNKIDEDTNTGFEQWDPYTDCGHVHVVKKVSPGNYYPGVTLSHYGPIEQVGTGIPVTVKRVTIGGMCNWDAVGNDITSQCSYTMHPGNDREIRITGPFAAGYDYLIEPKDVSAGDYLYCGGLDPSITVPLRDVQNNVPGYAYLIRIAVPQDITLNGLLQPDDITAWVAAPEDTTLDGITDNADLVDVTEAVANSDDW